MAVVVITGASSGIGEATARLLAARGHDLILAARRLERLEAIAREIQERRGPDPGSGDAGGAGPGLGRAVEIVAADLSDPRQADRVAARALERFGRVDVWINNAGIGQGGKIFWEMSHQEIERLVDVDLVAPLLACRAVIPHMIAQGTGHIINVASVAGHIGTSPAYSAAKFGLRGFSEALRRQLAPHGIAVSIVSPGLIRTPMTRDVAMRMPGPERVARVIARLVRRPRREVVVPAWYRGLIAINRALPALADRTALRIYRGVRGKQ